MPDWPNRGKKGKSDSRVETKGTTKYKMVKFFEENVK